MYSERTSGASINDSLKIKVEETKETDIFNTDFKTKHFKQLEIDFDNVSSIIISEYYPKTFALIR